MGTVLTYGTFDLFHVGHVRLLKRARALGNRLFVGISTDEFNASKGKIAVYNYDARCEIVQACASVDGVFPEHNWDQKRSDILRYSASVLTMGDDWEGRFDSLMASCSVIYLPRTAGVSTTNVKEKIKGLLPQNYSHADIVRM